MLYAKPAAIGKSEYMLNSLTLTGSYVLAQAYSDPKPAGNENPIGDLGNRTDGGDIAGCSSTKSRDSGSESQGNK